MKSSKIVNTEEGNAIRDGRMIGIQTLTESGCETWLKEYELAKAAKEGARLIKLECINDPDFEFTINMKL